MSETFEGQCTCGEVHYRLLSRPLFVNCCHCFWCQRETGSAFVINAMIEKDRVELIKGEVATIDLPTRSGKGQRVIRCPKCQVALWSHYLAGNKSVSFVRVGTLNNPHLLPPDIHIHTTSKQPWVILPDNIPIKTGYYAPKNYWPEESRQRYAALSKKKS